jgi:hypothetical protein
MNEYNNVAVCNITFYKFDDDGNELLNEDGTIKEFDLKAIRFKPLEYLCEDLDADDLEEIKEIDMNNIKFTQEDAEYLAEWFNFVNSKSFGILSEEFKNEVIKADIIRGNLTQLMYENSNWRIKRKYRKGKYSKATIEYVSNKENEDE